MKWSRFGIITANKKQQNLVFYAMGSCHQSHTSQSFQEVEMSLTITHSHFISQHTRQESTIQLIHNGNGWHMPPTTPDRQGNIIFFFITILGGNNTLVPHFCKLNCLNTANLVRLRKIGLGSEIKFKFNLI